MAHRIKIKTAISSVETTVKNEEIDKTREKIRKSILNSEPIILEGRPEFIINPCNILYVEIEDVSDVKLVR